MIFAVDIEEQVNGHVIVVRGELDIDSAPQLREALLSVISDGCRILVDLEAVEFIDSTGMGILVGGLKRARLAGGELELVCASRIVLRPFELTGLDQVFTIHARRETALKPLAPPLLDHG
jgi:anti-sigma B factor antagonist